jgi:hypothetical protein
LTTTPTGPTPAGPDPTCLTVPAATSVGAVTSAPAVTTVHAMTAVDTVTTVSAVATHVHTFPQIDIINLVPSSSQNRVKNACLGLPPLYAYARRPPDTVRTRIWQLMINHRSAPAARAPGPRAKIEVGFSAGVQVPWVYCPSPWAISSLRNTKSRLVPHLPCLLARALADINSSTSI